MAISPRKGRPDDPRDAQILASVGARVRRARRDSGWTIDALAQRAGLSDRFIQQIESGIGNPSLLSLHAVARAFNLSIVDLLDHIAEEAPAPPPTARAVALVGLRGAGKTAIGARAAAELGVRFVELDAVVERRAGMAAGELIELHGAEYFRRLEREALEETLAAGGDLIIATSGGLVTDLVALERLLGATTTVWLRARPEDHFRRVLEQGDTRPMANRERAMDELRAILTARRPLYERAHQMVDTSRLGLERSVERVAKIARRALAG